MKLKEFSLIERYFQHHAYKRKDTILGIGDDCALLSAPENQWLAVSTDTMNEGVHFFPDTDPRILGYKSLAVSLSDLAAMGAEPAWVLLSLTLPTIEESWLSAFCEGFFELADRHNIQLVGGNTTQGLLSISTYVTGFIPQGQALCRSGAKTGNSIYVTGTLGNAALALHCLQKKIDLSPVSLNDMRTYLEKPVPRINCGLALRNIATSAIDISDGLVADLGHLLEASQVGATLYLEHLPLSEIMRQAVPPDVAIELALTGGEDYELCFTAHPDQNELIKDLFLKLKVPCLCIGKIEEKMGLRGWLNGKYIEDMESVYKGYEHFGISDV